MHTSAGKFLGYTATDKNIYYIDSTSKRIKITTHCSFDEAGMTIPPTEQSPATKALQNAGITKSQDLPDDLLHHINYNSTNEQSTLQVKLLSQNAKLPVRATDGAAGYDVYSVISITIEPGQRALIPLDIQFSPPPGTYIQIASRSGLSAKHLIDTTAGVIDSDYTGNVTVVLHNSGKDAYQVNIGDRIAQILIIHIDSPKVVTVDTQNSTTRAHNGFGSTGTDAILHTMSTTLPDNVIKMPYDIFCSQYPFDQLLDIDIIVKCDHETLGMQFKQCPQRHRLQLQDMALSTPASRIPKW
jgi:dUTP pyrophosphatase